MSKSTSRGRSGEAAQSTRVSAARLHHKSGTSNSFGSYTTVNNGGGSYTMKPTSSLMQNSGK